MEARRTVLPRRVGRPHLAVLTRRNSACRCFVMQPGSTKVTPAQTHERPLRGGQRRAHENRRFTPDGPGSVSDPPRSSMTRPSLTFSTRNLRVARHARDLSIEQVAVATERSSFSVRLWESGRVTPPTAARPARCRPRDPGLRAVRGSQGTAASPGRWQSRADRPASAPRPRTRPARRGRWRRQVTAATMSSLPVRVAEGPGVCPNCDIPIQPRALITKPPRDSGGCARLLEGAHW